LNKSILIPIIIVAIGGSLTGIFLIPMFEGDIPKETVYTLEIDNKTVYEIVINSTDKSKWNTQDSNVMINGTIYSLELFTESIREIDYQYHKTEPKCILLPFKSDDKSYVYDCVDYLSICDRGQSGETQSYTGCYMADKPTIKHFDTVDLCDGKKCMELDTTSSEIICWQGLPYKTYRLIAELPEGWYQEDQVPELIGWQILQYNYSGCVGK